VENIIIYKDKRFYCAFPRIAKLQNGELLIVFREAPQRKPYSDHLDYEARAVLLRSKDKGRTWGERIVICEGGMQNISLVQITNKTILANFYKWHIVKEPPFNHRIEGTFITQSLDNGYTWEKPVKIKVSDGLVFATYSSILELPDSNLLIPLYGSYPGEKSRAVVLRSTDKGKTWKDLKTIAFDPFGNLAFHEPVLCRLPSGKILCMIRQRQITEYLYQSESLDNGETWSFPKMTNLWGHPADLLVLRDGRILCTYGYRRPPYGVRGCLSYDEGKTWDIKNEIIIRNDGFHGDLGYPSSVELEDNQILTVYYFHTGKPVSQSSYSHYSQPAGIRYIAGTIYKV